MRHVLSLAALLLFATAGLVPGGKGGGLVFQAESYGAVGDASTDNTVAIRAAIAAAEAANGGIVQFGPGEFWLTDTLAVTTSGVILRGSGMSFINTEDDKGTQLYFRPPFGASSPTFLRIGHQSDALVGCGIQDMSLVADTGNAGHMVWASGVQTCTFTNVWFYHNTAKSSGKAGLFLDCTATGAPTTSVWTLNCRFNVARGASLEGYGVLIDCNVAPAGFNNDNHFVNCKFNNAEDPGAAIRIQSTGTGAVSGHKFTNCRVDTGTDEAAGVEIDDSDRNSFVNFTIDGATGDDVLIFSGSSEQNTFIGAIDGSWSDDQADPAEAALIIDRSGTDGQEFMLPWVNVMGLHQSPPATTDGTMFRGARDGDATPGDTLFVRINGSWVQLAP